MARTVGIEEEFLLVGARQAGLAETGDAVAETADDSSDGQFEHELMRQQVELGTEPHTELAQLWAELVRRRAELARAAGAHGSRIAAAATSPIPAAPNRTLQRRYERMGERFGRTAAGALSCGMHVHVGVESRIEGLRVLNGIRGWLPLLLALSCNSPFHDGGDTGYRSYRRLLWHEWPTAGAYDTFADPAEYDQLIATLVDSGAAIDTAGVYLDARLSARYPTVEIRVFDVCPDPVHAVALAGLARGLVDACAVGALPATAPALARVETVRAAMWRAARYGMTDTLMHPARGGPVPAWELAAEVRDVLRQVRTAAHPDDASVETVLAGIEREGTGADLQHRLLAGGGDMQHVLVGLIGATTAPGTWPGRRPPDGTVGEGTVGEGTVGEGTVGEGTVGDATACSGTG